MISRLFACTAMWLCCSSACTAVQAPLPPPVRTQLSLGAHQILHSFAVSPDAALLAIALEDDRTGLRSLFVSSLNVAGQPLTQLSDAEDADLPFFAPDSAHLGYFARGAIWQRSVAGPASPIRVVDAAGAGAGATWTIGGEIVFASEGSPGLMRVAASGGRAAQLTTRDSAGGEIDHQWPHALEDGSVLFTVSERGRDPHLEVVSSDGKRTRLRVPAYGQAQYVGSGHVVYSYLANLMAIRFDVARRETLGVPVAVARGIQVRDVGATIGRASFSVSSSGTLVWVRGTPDDARSVLVAVSEGGTQKQLAAPPEVYQTPRISPDGSQIAVVVRSGVMTRELRLLDAREPSHIRMTISGGDNHSPAWVDAARLTFGSNRDGAQNVYIASVAGDQTKRKPGPEATALFPSNASVSRNPSSWTRPPQLLALYEITPPSNRNVLVYRLNGSVTPMANTAANERAPAISPDGKWLAFVSDIAGRDEVYVMPVDRSREPARLTSDGGAEPVWRRGGLFYRRGDSIVRLEMPAALPDLPGRTQQVLSGYYGRDPGGNLPAFDVSEDGKTFLLLKSAARPRELRTVRHWSTELVTTLPLGRR